MTADGASYGSFTDVQVKLGRIEDDERIKARAESALVSTTERLIAELGFDFFRHPSVDDAVWFAQPRVSHRGKVLHVHTGVVSVTGIRVRSGRDVTFDWEDLDATDYDLERWAREDDSEDGTDTVAAVVPFDHIRLNGTSTIRNTWPRGNRLIEVTGVRGWPQITRMAIDANVDWARQEIAADRTYPGSTQTPDQFGQPVRTPAPESVVKLAKWALNRFACDN